MVRNVVFIFAVSMLAALEVCGQGLPGTEPLTWDGDLAARMLDGIDRVLERETAAAGGRNEARRLTSANVEAKRARFRKIVGVVDARVPVEMHLQATVERPALVADAGSYRVYAVRWTVLDGVDAEGLLFEPRGVPAAQIVTLPDADQTPETAPFAVRLAESGCRVLVPVLIDRKDTWSGNAKIKFTNQPHREWIYRMAYEMGRHPVGYEVEKVMAAVDWFMRDKPALSVGVAGYGEGGLVAFYSAALDKRIRATLVSGYFAPREGLWEEPIYRNVWGLLREFGDAEIAGLVAPRALVVEASRNPEVPGPPPVREGRRGAAPGRIVTPDTAAVRGEFARAQSIRATLGGSMALIESRDPGSEEALRVFLAQLGVSSPRPAGQAPAIQYERTGRKRACVASSNNWSNYTQKLVQAIGSRRGACSGRRRTPRRWSDGRRPRRTIAAICGRRSSASFRIRPNP